MFTTPNGLHVVPGSDPHRIHPGLWDHMQLDESWWPHRRTDWALSPRLEPKNLMEISWKFWMKIWHLNQVRRKKKPDGPDGDDQIDDKTHMITYMIHMMMKQLIENLGALPYMMAIDAIDAIYLSGDVYHPLPQDFPQSDRHHLSTL